MNSVLDKVYFLLITKVMIRVKFIKNHKSFKAGDVETVSKNEAFGLIDAGFAVISKDMTDSDYKTGAITPLTPSVPSVFITPKTKTSKRR